MEENIVVHVVELPDRRYLAMRYVDPITAKQVRRSTKTTNRREAEKVAAKWEAELREGRYQAPSRVLWQTFRERYEAEVLPSLAAKTVNKCDTVLDSVEKTIGAARLADITATTISRWQSKLRERKLSESTIASYSAHLRSALQWAVHMGMMREVPRIEKPKRAKGAKVMKGRPITGEEFDRMIEAVPKIVGKKRADAWKAYLNGLWQSGLRLGESLDLYWDRDDKLRVDLDGKRPMLQVRAELEKGNRDRLMPIVPEFAEALQAVPVEQRTGPVFVPLTRTGLRPSVWCACQIIGRIGKAAGVKVDVYSRTGKPKFATAHDLRRSFGQRWSTRVMPQLLMQLMRHESIDTTQAFYVLQDAEATADLLWKAHDRARGTSSGASEQNAETTTPANR